MEKPEALQLSPGERQNLLTQPALRTERVQMMLRSTVLSILSKEIPANYIVSQDDLENLRRMLVGIENDLHKILPFLQSSYPQPGWDELIAKTQEMLTKASERLDENVDLHPFDDDALQAAVIAVATRLKEMARAFDEMELDDVTVLEQTEKIRKGVTQDMLLADEFVRVPVVEKPKPVIRFETNGSVWEEIEASYEPPTTRKKNKPKITNQKKERLVKPIDQMSRSELIDTVEECFKGELRKVTRIRIIDYDIYNMWYIEQGWNEQLAEAMAEDKFEAERQQFNARTLKANRATAKKKRLAELRQYAQQGVLENHMYAGGQNSLWRRMYNDMMDDSTEIIAKQTGIKMPKYSKVHRKLMHERSLIGQEYQIDGLEYSDQRKQHVIHRYNESGRPVDPNFCMNNELWYLREILKDVGRIYTNLFLKRLKDNSETTDVIKAYALAINFISEYIKDLQKSSVQITNYNELRGLYLQIIQQTRRLIEDAANSLPAESARLLVTTLQHVLITRFSTAYAATFTSCPFLRPENEKVYADDPILKNVQKQNQTPDEPSWKTKQSTESTDPIAHFESHIDYDLAAIPTIRIIDYDEYQQWLRDGDWIEKLAVALAKDRLEQMKKEKVVIGGDKNARKMKLQQMYDNTLLPEARKQMEAIHLQAGGAAERDSLYSICSDALGESMGIMLSSDGVDTPRFSQVFAQLVEERIKLGTVASLPGIRNATDLNLHTFQRPATGHLDAKSTSRSRLASDDLEQITVASEQWLKYAEKNLSHYKDDDMSEHRCDAIFGSIAAYFHGLLTDNTPITNYQDHKAFYEQNIAVIKQRIANGVKGLPDNIRTQVQQTIEHLVTRRLAANYGVGLLTTPPLQPLDQADYDSDEILQYLRRPTEDVSPEPNTTPKWRTAMLEVIPDAHSHYGISTISKATYEQWVKDSNWEERLVAMANSGTDPEKARAGCQMFLYREVPRLLDDGIGVPLPDLIEQFKTHVDVGDDRSNLIEQFWNDLASQCKRFELGGHTYLNTDTHTRLAMSSQQPLTTSMFYKMCALGYKDLSLWSKFAHQYFNGYRSKGKKESTLKNEVKQIFTSVEQQLDNVAATIGDKPLTSFRELQTELYKIREIIDGIIDAAHISDSSQAGEMRAALKYYFASGLANMAHGTFVLIEETRPSDEEAANDTLLAEMQVPRGQDDQESSKAPKWLAEMHEALPFMFKQDSFLFIDKADYDAYVEEGNWVEKWHNAEREDVIREFNASWKGPKDDIYEQELAGYLQGFDIDQPARAHLEVKTPQLLENPRGVPLESQKIAMQKNSEAMREVIREFYEGLLGKATSSDLPGIEYKTGDQRRLQIPHPVSVVPGRGFISILEESVGKTVQESYGIFATRQFADFSNAKKPLKAEIKQIRADVDQCIYDELHQDNSVYDSYESLLALHQRLQLAVRSVIDTGTISNHQIASDVRESLRYIYDVAIAWSYHRVLIRHLHYSGEKPDTSKDPLLAYLRVKKAEKQPTVNIEEVPEITTAPLHSTHFVSHWWDNTWADTEKRLQLENVEDANGWRAALRPVKERVAKRITTADSTIFTSQENLSQFLSGLTEELVNLPGSITINNQTVDIPTQAIRRHLTKKIQELEDRLRPGLPTVGVNEAALTLVEAEIDEAIALAPTPMETIKNEITTTRAVMEATFHSIEKTMQELEDSGDTAGMTALLVQTQRVLLASRNIVNHLHSVNNK